MAGLEPAALCSQSRCATNCATSRYSKAGASCGIRTRGLAARQASTLAAELKKLQFNVCRSRVPAPPNRCGRFPLPARELNGSSCVFWHRVRGSNPRTRDETPESWTTRRTRQREGGLHFGCAQTRASRRMWCLAARSSNLAMNLPRTSRAANTIRAATECKDTAEVKPTKRQIQRTKTKGPDPFRDPGLCVQSLEGVRLRAASLSRMNSVLVWARHLNETVRLTRSDTHTRSQPLQGSVVGDGVTGFHDKPR